MPSVASGSPQRVEKLSPSPPHHPISFRVGERRREIPFALRNHERFPLGERQRRPRIDGACQCLQPRDLKMNGAIRLRRRNPVGIISRNAVCRVPVSTIEVARSRSLLRVRIAGGVHGDTAIGVDIEDIKGARAINLIQPVGLVQPRTQEIADPEFSVAADEAYAPLDRTTEPVGVPLFPATATETIRFSANGNVVESGARLRSLPMRS